VSRALDAIDGVVDDPTQLFVTAIPAVDPGRVVGLVGVAGSGLTRLGLTLLADPARRGTVAAVDVRGWLCPAAAWEVGIPEERLVVVRCADRDLWPKVTAALLDGISAVYAEVPAGVPATVLRRLGALARARAVALLLRPVRGGLPNGLTHLSLVADGVRWEGTDAGHGRLTRRRLTLRASGRGVLGIDRIFEVDDDGTDAVRVVSGLAAAPAGRAAG
jgi:hypothetical protein